MHRDVKAPNVMRDTSGRLVLGDFGTGLEIAEEEAGVVLAGTPVYLAPEAFRRKPATPQSDIYSLGVLLFHLAAAAFPVVGRTLGELRAAHAAGDRRSLSVLRPGFPPALTSAIERALAGPPGERHQRAEEMELALAAALDERVPAGHPLDVAGAGHRYSRRVRRQMVSIALGILILIAGFAIAVTSNARGRTVLASLGVFSAPAPSNAAPAVSPTRRLRRIEEPSDIEHRGRPSPDGRLHTAVVDGDLGVFDPDSGDHRRLTDRTRDGGRAFESSVFSSDGEQVAYAWLTADDERELRIVPVRGGESRVLWRSRDEIPHPVDWSSDGGRMLVVLQQRDGRRTLGTISAADASVVRIAPLDSGHSNAKLSPDGRYAAYDGLQGIDDIERDVFIAALERPDDRQVLVAAASDDAAPFWTPDGRHLMFISDRTSEPSVWVLPVRDGLAAGEPAILHRNIGRIDPTGLTTGGALFYALQVGLVDVFQANLELSREPAADGVRPLAPEQVGSKMNSDWSADGSLAVFVSLPHAGTGSAPGRRLSILHVDSGTVRRLNPPLSY